MALSPNQPFVAAGFDDTTICIWDATTGALVEQLLWHQDPVCSIVFTPDGKTLVSSDSGGTVKFWNVKELLGASNGEKNNKDAHVHSVTTNTLYASMRRYPVCFSLLLYYDATLPMLD